MNYKPMFDRVVILQDEAETVTSAGFIIPDSSAEKANTGRVLATGPGRVTKDGITIPMTVQVDSKVMFPVGAGIKVRVNGTEALVLKEDEIIAIVE